MANAKIILDSRRAKSDGSFNVIYRITHFKKVYTINSGVSIIEKHWNEQNSEIAKSHPNSKLLNLKLLKKYFQIQKAILELEDAFSIEDLRNIIEGKPRELEFISFKVFADKLILEMMKTNNVGNALVYQTAINRFIEFCGNPNIKFQEVNYVVLEQFKQKLIEYGLKQNTISNYFRTLRAIYNKAIKQKLVERSFYPFYDIGVKSDTTIKRAISNDELFKLRNISLEENLAAWKALNYFMLSYYLIGISFTDLAYLKHENVVDGRVVYKRRKTHKIYSIKLFPQAEAILLDLTRENSKYLLPILSDDTPEDSLKAKRVIQQCIKTTNKYLKRLSTEAEINGLVTTYVARHTFATTAKRLGYSNELIAEALGHEYGNKITNIYLDSFDKEVVDLMHQKVIEIL